MPLLDVSSVLTDPDFADVISVTRRVQVVSNTGRVSTTDTVFPRLLGVVTMANPSDLDRGDDMQSNTRTIQLVLKFPLCGVSTGNQPDVVTWRGDNYVVRHVDLYPQFGAGFYQAECESIDKTDVKLLSGYTQQLNFTQPSNAVYAVLG